jgi:endonuclease-3
LDLGEEGLKTYIKTIGLFNSKAANIIKLCRKLLDDFQGEVPQTRTELESLAGVGRKTANVILNTAFGQPVMAVDTHILLTPLSVACADKTTAISNSKVLL